MSNRKVTAVVVGRRKEWVVRTPDGRTHIGETKAESMTAAINSEKARRERIVR